MTAERRIRICPGNDYFHSRRRHRFTSCRGAQGNLPGSSPLFPWHL